MRYATILLLLLQDGVVNGAIYALIALSLVLVFTVTRVRRGCAVPRHNRPGRRGRRGRGAAARCPAGCRPPGSILLLLLQDGVVNGAIYALIALSLVLVFTVTRVILIPRRAQEPAPVEGVPSLGTIGQEGEAAEAEEQRHDLRADRPVAGPGLHRHAGHPDPAGRVRRLWGADAGEPGGRHPRGVHGMGSWASWGMP
jgi:hypothetical protein